MSGGIELGEGQQGVVMGWEGKGGGKGWGEE